MVFVHARNATVKTANIFRELSTQKNHQTAFQPQDSNRIGIAKKAFERCHSKELSELLNSGFSVHHAGLLRSDRLIYILYLFILQFMTQKYVYDLEEASSRFS